MKKKVQDVEISIGAKVFPLFISRENYDTHFPSYVFFASSLIVLDLIIFVSHVKK
jgi:hypothetical protein